MKNMTKKIELMMVCFLFVLLGQNVFAANCDCVDEATTGIYQAECLALVALYTSTNGAGWTDSTNWNTDTACNTWFGVTTVGMNVTMLVMNDNNLTGPLPLEINNLPELKHLRFPRSNLTGDIPPINNLTKLVVLHLTGNKLTALPIDLSTLSNIVTFNVSANQLTNGIPTTISGMTNLKNLFLYANNLNGSIPDSLTNLLNLARISLHSNNLTGGIPAFTQTTITEINLRSNQLEDTIPASLAGLPNLEQLYLNDNDLSGPIPEFSAADCKLDDYSDSNTPMDLRWNNLTKATDPTDAFLKSVQVGGDYMATQGPGNNAIGDLNADGALDLGDVIIGLQFLSEYLYDPGVASAEEIAAGYPVSGVDVDNGSLPYGRLGMEEVSYIMEKLGGKRARMKTNTYKHYHRFFKYYDFLNDKFE